MARYLIKLNDKPQNETNTITNAIEYIITCSGKKCWRPFFISNEFLIYDNKEEKKIWSSKVNFKPNEVLKFNVYGLEIIGKYLHYNKTSILIEVEESSIYKQNEIITIHSNFLCQ